MFFRRAKARRWAKKITKKNLKTTQPVECESYLHPADKAALSVLKKIPLFDKLCGKFIEFINEPQCHIINMANKIQITDQQCPRVYYMVESICHKLGIEMPDLYLELNRTPNAYTYGNKKVFITVTSGLLECMEDDEIYAVLAHECGHIACHHVLYTTMYSAILGAGEFGFQLLNSVIGDLISIPLRLAFFHWQRCSELSADRAAVVCCESAAPVIETMMRLAGGTVHIDEEIKPELFLAQAVDYQELMNDSKASKALEFLLTHQDSHPLLSVRARQAQEWADSDEYRAIIN